MPSVVLSPYNPISVEAIFEGSRVSDLEHVAAWRMNLAAVSSRDERFFFVAVHRHINYYRIPHPTQKTIVTAGKLAYEGNLNLRSIINAIRIGQIGNEEVLVAVDDEGYVYVWFTANLDRHPIVLTHSESAWGIATHGPNYLVAASANSHTIMVWNLRSKAEGGNISSIDMEEEDPLGGLDERELIGHDHNVPAIDFSRCGKFLVSCSIDGTVRFWDLRTGQIVLSKATDTEWAWAARFISYEAFKHVPSTVPESCNPFHTRRQDVVHTTWGRLKYKPKIVKPSWNSIVSGNSTEATDDELEDGTDDGMRASSLASYAESDIDAESASSDETHDSGELYGRITNQHLIQGDTGTESFPVVPITMPEGENCSGHANIVPESDIEPSGLTSADDPGNANAMEESDYDATSDDNPGEWSSDSESGAGDHPFSDMLNEGVYQVYDDDYSDAESLQDFSIPGYPGYMEDDGYTEFDESYLGTGNSANRPVGWRRQWRQRPYEPPAPQRVPTVVAQQDEFSDDFVIATTKTNLFLLDPRSLRTLHSQPQLIDRLDPRLDPVLNVHDRLCMVEVIEELNVAVVASQKGTAAIVRLLRTNDEEAGQSQFMMAVEDFLPQQLPPIAPLLGMFVVKELSAVEPSLSLHQVYLLYADGRMYAYELRSSPLANPLAVHGVQI